MGAFIDMAGDKYGRLTVLYRSNKRGSCGQIYWHCRCDCGNEVDVLGYLLRQGHTKSCGCYNVEMASVSNKTHGMSRTRIHNIWKGMRQRCYCGTNDAYANYGGRGIKVCDEWSVFENFYNWALANGWKEDSTGISIDRIDVNGDYCPENCRWASAVEQANNKRNTLMLTARGETKAINDWARDVGINCKTIRGRLDNGWSADDAIFTPAGSLRNKSAKVVEYNGESHTILEWSEITGLYKELIRSRLSHGWSVEDALSTPNDGSRHQHNRKEVTT